MGSTLREVIELIGWGPRDGEQISVVLAGTANALIPARLLDTPLTYDAMSEAGTGLGSAGFIVFDDTTAPIAIAAGVARFLAVESCGQCEPCKTDGLFISDTLRRSLQQRPSDADIIALRRRIDTVAIGARCNLARQQATVTASLLLLFPDALGPDSHLAPASNITPVSIAPISDLIGGRVIVDSPQLTKQPDWSYDDADSGAAPAARLGNTPVQVHAAPRNREWPEWAPHIETDHPLQIIDDAHDAIDSQIHEALDADPAARADAVSGIALNIRTHIDVTRRILYPMVRRVGGETGDALADATESHEDALNQLVEALLAGATREALRKLSLALQHHADLEEQILDVLRGQLDPDQRSSLADGLAAARSTSTVTPHPENFRDHIATGGRRGETRTL
jgi:NADH-ubiquinone oxidoreductase-F iron-sulfur binding region/Hemerythrin HHE cation binding domain